MTVKVAHRNLKAVVTWCLEERSGGGKVCVHVDLEQTGLPAGAVVVVVALHAAVLKPALKTFQVAPNSFPK